LREPIKLSLYFDYISPYAYIAWTQLPALAERNGCIVEPMPTLFAALLDAGGQKGPAEIPAKRLWVWKDTLRTARLLGLPFQPPPHHPFNPLLGLRVTALVEDLASRARLIDELYRATWGGGGGIDTPAAVAAAADRAGLDGAALVQRAGEPEAKQRVRAITDEAIAIGVFGVPTLRVGDELFWGYDAFPHLERHLRGEDPLRPGELERWRHVAPSAQRKGGLPR